MSTVAVGTLISHTRLVRILKTALPLVAIALLSTVFLVQENENNEGGLVFSSADLATLGDGLAINNPRIEGTTRDGNAYLITAEKAVPDQSQAERIEMSAFSAITRYSSGLSVEVHSPRAVAVLPSQNFSMLDHVSFRTSDGYTGNAGSADVDVKSGTLVASGGVSVDGPTGRIEADRLSVQSRFDENGDATDNPILKFEGGVALRFVSGVDE